ncbi:GNAT family N-acetyltransferase [Paenibacillus gansuensis]|uniref:GNAT family N-acetyltransferase n=1 Tax=Paenibacillus gansuensis TaxID=306542 RepID=A0ABW5PLF5_9BACL
MLELKQDSNTFYLGEPDHKEAEIHYVRREGKLIVDHTFVAESLRGRKIGDALVRRMVEFAREEQAVLVPLCPFAKKVIERTPEYQDIASK